MNKCKKDHNLIKKLIRYSKKLKKKLEELTSSNRIYIGGLWTYTKPFSSGYKNPDACL